VNDSIQTPDLPEQTPETPAAKAFPGRLLRELRESRNLTIGDVAQALKFSPRQIEALERDDFAALPGVTFLRGFIRSYARWLKTDPAPLLLMLDDESPEPTPEILAPETMGAAMPRPRGAGNKLPILAGVLLVAALAALAVQYLQPGQWPNFALPAMNAKSAEPLVVPVPVVAPPIQELPATTVISTETAQPVVAPAAVETPSVAAAPTPTPPPTPPPAKPVAVIESPAPIAPRTLPVVPVAPVVVPVAPAVSSVAANVPAKLPLQTTSPSPQPSLASPSGPPMHQLVFSFAGKSWVEVRDANRHTVLAQMNEPGSRQVVTGKPPFQVVVGNATQVRLQMDERAIDLVPFIRAEVARLTVE
jgi:cytoskeleton protein RodZ